MAGYTRQSSADIVNGLEITAPPLSREFNKLAQAFDLSLGHSHTGIVGEGPKINLETATTGILSASQGGTGAFNNLNGQAAPIATDDAAAGYALGSVWLYPAERSIYICFDATEDAAVWIQYVQIKDAAIAPPSDNTIDLGTAANTFRDAFLTGTLTSGPIQSSDTIEAAQFTGPLTGNVTGDVTGNIWAMAGTSQLESLTIGTELDLTNSRIRNVATPINPSDASTKNYVDNALNDLLDAAPDTLNTLNELAAALGDDPEFATTVSNDLAKKLDKAGGTMTGDIAMGGNKVTGLAEPTSGSDAVNLTYVTELFGSTDDAAASADLAERWASEPEDVIVQDGKYSSLHYSLKSSASATSAGNSASTATTKATQASNSATLAQRWANEDEDVAVQNGLFSAFHYAQKAEQTLTETEAASDFVSATNGGTFLDQVVFDTNDNSTPAIFGRNDTPDSEFLSIGVSGTFAQFRFVEDTSVEGTGNFGFYQFILAGDAGEADVTAFQITKDGLSASGNTVWTEANDGAGSGLDADLLDGLQASQFLRSDQPGTIPNSFTVSGSNPQVIFEETDEVNKSRVIQAGGDLYVQSGETPGNQIRFSGINSSDLDLLTVQHSGGTRDIWHSGNDGPGSGLDADLLDGVQGSSYARRDQSNTFAGDINLNNNDLVGVQRIYPFDLIHFERDGPAYIDGNSGVYFRTGGDNDIDFRVLPNQIDVFETLDINGNDIVNVKGLKFIDGGDIFNLDKILFDGSTSGDYVEWQTTQGMNFYENGSKAATVGPVTRLPTNTRIGDGEVFRTNTNPNESGSLVFAKNKSASTVAIGDNIAGSNLDPSSTADQNGAFALNGTWKCLGLCEAGRSTLFVRIT